MKRLIRVMKSLEIKSLCVCDITALLGLAQFTVSKHLNILEDSGQVAFVDRSRINAA